MKFPIRRRFHGLEFFFAGGIKSGISAGTFLGGFCVFKESILNSKNPSQGLLIPQKALLGSLAYSKSLSRLAVDVFAWASIAKPASRIMVKRA